MLINPSSEEKLERDLKLGIAHSSECFEKDKNHGHKCDLFLCVAQRSLENTY